MKMKKEDAVRGLGLVQKKTGELISVNHNINLVGNKVLPISSSSDSASSSSSSLASSTSSWIRSNNNNGDDQQQCGPSDQIKIKGKVNGESNNNNSKNKTLARMKELLRWAAAVKAGKAGKFGTKGLHFRNRSATIKSGGLDGGESSKDSPKISLKWDAQSDCSAVSAPPSFKYDQYAPSRGSWITTDDEFVVLEL